MSLFSNLEFRGAVAAVETVSEEGKHKHERLPVAKQNDEIVVPGYGVAWDYDLLAACADGEVCGKRRG
jgi:hypothetical protein